MEDISKLFMLVLKQEKIITVWFIHKFNMICKIIILESLRDK